MPTNRPPLAPRGSNRFWLPSTPLVLASASPIRSVLLQQAGIAHAIVPSDIDERKLEADLASTRVCGVAGALASAKALSVSTRYPDRYILGCDQTCIFEGRLLHKANSLAELRDTLLAMSGKAHALISAAAIARDNKILAEFKDQVTIKFRHYTPAFLEAYLLETGPALLGTVGGYQLEQTGVMLFESVEGDYHTVMGLPMLQFLSHCRKLDLILS